MNSSGSAHFVREEAIFITLSIKQVLIELSAVFLNILNRLFIKLEPCVLKEHGKVFNLCLNDSTHYHCMLNYFLSLVARLSIAVTRHFSSKHDF